MPYSTSNVAGVNILDTFSTKPYPHGVGTVVSLSDGGEAIFVEALSLISAYAYALAYADGTAQMATTTLAANCKRGGWAQVEIPSAYGGWLQISGKPTGNLATACADFVPLYTTSTAGVLDDAIVTGGLILEAVSTVSINTAGTGALVVGRGSGIFTDNRG